MRMTQVENIHLKHVLQTVCVLETVVLRSFGPDGGQVLFIRDTGQVMLSRNGTRILKALRLEHPLARMVVECVWKHTAVTGDGSKTFVLLLASLLRGIQAFTCKAPGARHPCSSRAVGQGAIAKRLAEELLRFGLETLGDVVTAGVVPHGGTLSPDPAHTDRDAYTVQRLLATFFYTRLGHAHSDFISHLMCELLSHWRGPHEPPASSLRFIEDNFPALHTPVSGFPISCSRLVEGQVIHRDFSTALPQTDHQPIKAVVVSECLQPSVLMGGAVLQLGGKEPGTQEDMGGKERGILRYRAWTERSLQGVIAALQDLGVSLVLSAVKQSEAVLSLGQQAGICVVECVSEDELSLFAQLSGAKPVSGCWLIGQEHLAVLSFCRPILLGAHRYVHVAFYESEERPGIKPYSLVVCGPGEGQTDQCASAVRDALLMLLTTWASLHRTETTTETLPLNKSSCANTGETLHSLTNVPLPQKCALESGCVISAGGTFEFLLHYALLQHGYTSDANALSHTDTGIPAVVRVLAEALLSVPRQIYSNRTRCFLQSQTQVMRYIQSYTHPLDGSDYGSRSTKNNGEMEKGVSILDSGLESSSCKYQLILAVLQCVNSLLRIDSVLQLLHTQHKNSTASFEDTEESDEDSNDG